MTPYEAERQQRVAENQARLLQLGVLEAAKRLEAVKPAPLKSRERRTVLEAQRPQPQPRQQPVRGCKRSTLAVEVLDQGEDQNYTAGSSSGSESESGDVDMTPADQAVGPVVPGWAALIMQHSS